MADEVKEHYIWDDEEIEEDNSKRKKDKEEETEEKNDNSKDYKDEEEDESDDDEEERKPKKKEIKTKKKNNKKKAKENRHSERKSSKRENHRREKEHDYEDKDEKSYAWIWVVLVILIIIGGAIYLFKDKIWKKEEQQKSYTVAIINGESISSEKLDLYYKLLVPSSYKMFLTKEDFLNKSLIPQIVLLQEALSKNIDVQEVEIDSAIDDFTRQNGMTQEQLEQGLAEENLTMEQLRNLYDERIAIAKLLNQEITSKIEVTDKDAEETYKKNTSLYKAKPGEIRVSHILVKTEDEAKEIIKQLKEGGNFSKIAMEKSIDPSAKINGGDLGFFGKGMMVAEFENAAFALKIGETSAPVKTSYGYHIIRRGPDSYTFAEVKNAIKQRIIADKESAATELYIKQLKTRAEIELYPAEETTTAEIKIEEPQAEATTAEIKTFTMTADELCKENGKPVIRMYSALVDSHSAWIKEAFNSLAEDYKDRIAVYNWEIDTGDNLITTEIEKSIPKSEFDLYKKYNEKATVPTFVFGCKYIRVGTKYEKENDLEKEKEEFKAVIEELIK